MTRPLRTNPAFAHLAYEKTITTRLKVFLRRTYLGDELTNPTETLICEEVFPVDSHIPQEAIQHYIEKLTEEEAELERQIARFELVAPPTQGNHEQKSKKGSKHRQQKGGQGYGQGGRSG